MALRQYVQVPGALDTGPGIREPAALRVGDLFFSGAITGLDPQTGRLGSTPERQAELVFEHLRTLLTQTGLSPSDVARIFVWYTDHKLRELVNQPYLAMFPTQSDRPVRHAISRSLPGEATIQLEVVGVKGQGRRCLELPGLAHGGGIPGLVPYGVEIGNMLFSGGNTGRNPVTGEVGATLRQQAEFSFQNTRSLVEGAGLTLDDVAHLYVWLQDRRDLEAVDERYCAMFPNTSSRPVRHVIITPPMSSNTLLQVEVTAVRGANRSSIGPAGGSGPAPLGTRMGSMFYSGDILGKDLSTGRWGEGADAQTDLAFRNMVSLLQSVDLTASDLGHVFVWCKDYENGAAAARRLVDLLGHPNDPPAIHSLVTDLPAQAVVALDITAVA